MHRLALALALWSLAAPALAQDAGNDDRARVHFQAATQYYDDGRFEQAVPEFREAWRLSQRPEMLLNLATAAEHALQFGDAASALQEYLQHVPAPDNREALERRIQRNQDAAARMAHGQTVTADTTNSLTSTPTSTDTTPPPTHPPPPSSSSGLSSLGVAGLVTMGVGGATLIASLILGLVANDAYGNLETECPGHVCLTDHSGDASSGKSLALVSTVLLFVGGAIAATGVVLFALGLGEHHEDHAQATIELVPGPGELGLGARVRL